MYINIATQPAQPLLHQGKAKPNFTLEQSDRLEKSQNIRFGSDLPGNFTSTVLTPQALRDYTTTQRNTLIDLVQNISRTIDRPMAIDLVNRISQGKMFAAVMRRNETPVAVLLYEPVQFKRAVKAILRSDHYLVFPLRVAQRQAEHEDAIRRQLVTTMVESLNQQGRPYSIYAFGFEPAQVAFWDSVGFRPATDSLRFRTFVRPILDGVGIRRFDFRLAPQSQIPPFLQFDGPT